MTAPLVAVLRGEPDDEELTALTLALLMLDGQQAERPTTPPAPWVPPPFRCPRTWTAR